MKRGLSHQFILSWLMLLSLPGCRYVQWIEDVFYQGCNVKQYDTCAYLRSLHVYDQTSTLAHFDALWLSNEIRTWYAQAYAARRCWSDEKFKVFLRRQHEETRHFISFYVLSSFPGDDTILFSDKNSPWTISLLLDDCYCLAPEEIKLIDLSPEYMEFFGKTWSKFKKPYLVKFNARDCAGNYYITSMTRSISLRFASVERTGFMQWVLNPDGSAQYDRCCPNALMYDLYPCRGL